MRHVLPAFLTLLMGAGAAEAQWWDAGETPGALAGVSIEVDGRRVPLYAAPDGSPRWYLEAREGSTYAVVLSNRTPERLGIVLTVDGLNAISGERDYNRMYVLGPWEQSTISGWRGRSSSRRASAGRGRCALGEARSTPGALAGLRGRLVPGDRLGPYGRG